MLDNTNKWVMMLCYAQIVRLHFLHDLRPNVSHYIPRQYPQDSQFLKTCLPTSRMVPEPPRSHTWSPPFTPGPCPLPRLKILDPCLPLRKSSSSVQGKEEWIAVEWQLQHLWEQGQSSLPTPSYSYSTLQYQSTFTYYRFQRMRLLGKDGQIYRSILDNFTTS